MVQKNLLVTVSFWVLLNSGRTTHRNIQESIVLKSISRVHIRHGHKKHTYYILYSKYTYYLHRQYNMYTCTRIHCCRHYTTRGDRLVVHERIISIIFFLIEKITLMLDDKQIGKYV